MEIEDIKKISQVLSDDFRIIHKPKLTDPQNKNLTGTLKNDVIGLILGEYQNNGVEDDVEIAKKTLGFSLAEKLGLDVKPSDFD